MAKVNDLSRSLAALDQDTTLIAVVELSSKKWLVGATVPGVERQPLKKLGVQGLSGGGIPQFETIIRVVTALGPRLRAEPAEPDRHAA